MTSCLNSDDSAYLMIDFIYSLLLISRFGSLFLCRPRALVLRKYEKVKFDKINVYVNFGMAVV